MHDKRKTEIAKALQSAKLKAIEQINTCFYPSCNKPSINSHILQKNGILSELVEDGHLMQMEINHFDENIHFFKRTGIKKAFSFNCFCETHDNELFKSIELREIDFSIYKNCLLFTLRTKNNEKFRKMVNSKMRAILIEKHSNLFDIDDLERRNHQEKLGMKDIESTENVILSDIATGQESFVFLIRDISKIPICLSSFFNYETTHELERHIRTYGTDMEKVSDIFISVFPYSGKTKFMMGYKKQDEHIVKPYVNSIFKEKERRLLTKLTNLLLFQCETWVTSESFYHNRIKKVEKLFNTAVNFANANDNERITFNLNLFKESFCRDFTQWVKQIKI